MSAAPPLSRSRRVTGERLFRPAPEQVSAPAGLLPPPGGLAGAVILGFDFSRGDDLCVHRLFNGDGDLVDVPWTRRVAASRFDGRGGP